MTKKKQFGSDRKKLKCHPPNLSSRVHIKDLVKS